MGQALRSRIVLSRTVLVGRLAVRDLRDRPPQAFLLLLAITAATATLHDRDQQMLTVVTVVLVTLAVLNVIVTAWATVLDARHSSALARALGATPQQVSAGVTAAQLLPALPGALLGIPLGIGLFAAANGAGTQVLTIPPAWWLAAAVLGILVAAAGLTTIPARIGARRPAAPILQSELA